MKLSEGLNLENPTGYIQKAIDAIRDFNLDYSGFLSDKNVHRKYLKAMKDVKELQQAVFESPYLEHYKRRENKSKRK